MSLAGAGDNDTSDIHIDPFHDHFHNTSYTSLENIDEWVLVLEAEV